MDGALHTTPALLGPPGDLPRVTRNDGRALDEALAGGTLYLDRWIRALARHAEARAAG